ncbi:MAG: alpha/beta hydrolase [Pseudomonadota bacterium]
MRMSLFDRFLHFDRIVEHRFPPVGDIADISGRKVHVLRDGPRGGVPVVLIHGASGNIRDWTLSIFPRLTTRHDTIAIDRPGFGYSDRLPDYGWRLSDQIAHMRATLGALGVDRYVLAGHSYGGSLAMRWALDHPNEVAGLCLISAPVMDWGGGGIGAHYHIGGRPFVGDILAEQARFLGGGGFLPKAIATVFKPQPVPDGYLEDGGVELALRPPTFRTNSVMMLRLYEQMQVQAKRNSDLAVPTEIVHGKADTIVPFFVHAEPLSEMHPEAGLTLLDGVGHMPHHSHPETVLDAIDRLAGTA